MMMPRTVLTLLLVLGAGEAAAHSWYTGTHDPTTGFECCGGGDCAPIPDEAVREVPGGYLYLPTEEFIHSHDACAAQ
jgi:hypothetical protein